MILNEPILSVDLLTYSEKYEKEQSDYFLQTIGEFAFHTTEGYVLLFTTQNHYITVGYGGLKLYDLSYEFSKDKYELWSLGDEEWISEEETIFKGQRIISVTQEENYTIIQFDSFEMKLYEYDIKEGNEDFIDRLEYFKRGYIKRGHILIHKFVNG